MARTPRNQKQSESGISQTLPEKSDESSQHPIREPRNGTDYEAIYDDRREEAIIKAMADRLAQKRGAKSDNNDQTKLTLDQVK